MMPNAYCKKHDEIEPENHDFFTDGLWVCPKCSKQQTKLIDGMKPLDYALKQIQEKNS
jgi:Zn finger protein HypA/HybF involved in hydrogenase expression